MKSVRVYQSLQKAYESITRLGKKGNLAEEPISTWKEPGKEDLVGGRKVQCGLNLELQQPH